ncbi:MAG: hypothetical protein LBT12_00600 [Oscillospiraceae bacterium]|jgi:hypothetical protein|nr:hypothetical protein [Oscillospiraceae bacterium]
MVFQMKLCEMLWNTMVSTLSVSGIELQTVRGLWFSVMYRDGKVYVNKAKSHTPSCEISDKRPISKKEFLAVYDEDKASDSRNLSYIRPLIKKFSA